MTKHDIDPLRLAFFKQLETKFAELEDHWLDICPNCHAALYRGFDNKGERRYCLHCQLKFHAPIIKDLFNFDTRFFR